MAPTLPKLSNSQLGVGASSSVSFDRVVDLIPVDPIRIDAN